MRASQVALVATLTLAVILNPGCTDTPLGPDRGVLRVSVTTSGVDIDADGYTLVIGTPHGTIPVNADVMLTDVAVGEYYVVLDGVDPNCQIAGGPAFVRITPRSLARASFSVACVLRTGRIRLTTATTGTDVDADGYIVSIDGGPPQPVGANATLTLENVPGGNRGVQLRGVARNCQVTSGDTRSVVVPFGGGSVNVAFGVDCVAGGHLQITTSSSGVDIDPNGYQVAVNSDNFDTTAAVLATGTVAVTTLVPDDYDVTLSGVAANCDVTGANERTVTVAARATTAVPFGVVCAPVARLAIVRITDGNADIWTINSNGTDAIRLTTESSDEAAPAWSPYGQRIAFVSNRAGNPEIYVMNANGSGVTRLTQQIGRDVRPAWSPDGQRIAFESDRDGDGEIYVMNADGSGVARLTDNAEEDGQPAWSPDGQHIAFASNRDGNFEIYTMNSDGSGVVRRTNHDFDDTQPAWSPDGTRLAFVRVVGCDYYYGCDTGIYVMNADGSGVTAVTSGGHSEPAWSPDGRKIAFTVALCSDYYYCDDNTSTVLVVRPDGTGFGEVTDGSAASASWRR